MVALLVYTPSIKIQIKLNQLSHKNRKFVLQEIVIMKTSWFTGSLVGPVPGKGSLPVPPANAPVEEELVSWLFPAEVPGACCNDFRVLAKLNGRRTRLVSPVVFLLPKS